MDNELTTGKASVPAGSTTGTAVKPTATPTAPNSPQARTAAAQATPAPAAPSTPPATAAARDKVYAAELAAPGQSMSVQVTAASPWELLGKILAWADSLEK